MYHIILSTVKINTKPVHVRIDVSSQWSGQRIPQQEHSTISNNVNKFNNILLHKIYTLTVNQACRSLNNINKSHGTGVKQNWISATIPTHLDSQTTTTFKQEHTHQNSH